MKVKKKLMTEGNTAYSKTKTIEQTLTLTFFTTVVTHVKTLSTFGL